MKVAIPDYQKTARRLLEAVPTAERESLTAQFGDADFLKLAQAVKEICYSFWTSQPTVARTSVKV